MSESNNRSYCVALNEKWDVWICSSHPAVERRTNCFLWAPPSRINAQDPEKSLKQYKEFIMSSHLKRKLLPTLHNKRFGCWCYKGGVCHGATLAKLAEKAYIESQKESKSSSLLKREELPSVLFNSIRTSDSIFLKEPQFVSSFMESDGNQTIIVSKITNAFSVPILRSAICCATDQDEETIKIGPHTLVPRVTYALSSHSDHNLLVQTFTKLMEKYDSDVEFVGIGFPNFTIYTPRVKVDLDTEGKVDHSSQCESILLPNDFADQSLVDKPNIDGENVCVLQLLEITNHTGKKTTKQVILYSQHYFDVESYENDLIDQFICGFYDF